MKVRCPHCHTTLDLGQDSSFENLDCPTCGSRFSLIGTEETADFSPNSRRRIAHFELMQQLGAGAFGVVWRAHDTALDREVAIKIPRKGQLSPSESEIFLREARAAAQLNHPSVVSVHEVGREDDSVYIVSDLIQGVTLNDWLSGYRPTPREAANLCACVAEALQHAHENGVTHRDLKPGNLMIDRQGDVYLMDFGLAKRDVGEVTMTLDGQVLGTPAYLSPEAAQGDSHKADARSDIYSLGVILFEMLTGERPFRGNARMIIHQLLSEEAPSPRRLNGTIPRDLETICVKCLRRDPDKRYGSAKALTDDLRRWLEGIPIRARQVGRMEKAWLWCRRHKVISTLAAVVLLGLFSTSFALFEAERAKQRAVTETEQRRRDLYFSRINLAYQLWDENNYANTTKLLEETAVLSDGKFLDFEWYYLWNALEPRRTAASISFANVPSSIRFINDNSICIGSWSGEVTRHDLNRLDAAHRELLPADIGQRLLLNDEYAIGFKFGSGSSVTSHYAYWDEGLDNLIIKSVETDRDPIRIAGVNLKTSIAFDREGTRVLVLLDSGEFQLIDLVTGDVKTSIRVEITTLTESVRRTIALSPDMKWFALMHQDGPIQVWSLGSGEQAWAYAELAEQSSRVLEFSPDSTQLAVGTENGPVRLYVFDVETGDIVAERSDHTDAVRGLAYSPDGQILASGSRDNSIRLWNAEDLTPLTTLKGHSGIVNDVAFSPDGSTLVSTAQDYTAVIWPVPDFPRCRPKPDELRLKAKTHGERVFARENDTLTVFDLASSERLHSSVLDGLRADAFDVNRSGVVARADGRVIELSYPREQEARRRLVVNEPVVTLSLRDDSNMVGYATSHGTVGVFDGISDEPLEGTDVHSNVRAIAFNHTRPVMATGGGEWGRVGDSEIYIWDISNGAPQLLTRLAGHLDPVTNLVFSPDGDHLVSSSVDNSILIWKWQSSSEPERLVGHTATVRQVLFSPSGRRLVSCAGDRTVRFWDWETGRQCGRIRLSGDLKGISAIDWIDDHTLFGIDHFSGFHIWRGPKSH